MTTQPEYKTTTAGAIDYASYDRRAREIRSQDAWGMIGAIGRAVKIAADLIKRRTSTVVTQFEKVPGRMPMRSPEARRASPTRSPAKAEPMRR